MALFALWVCGASAGASVAFVMEGWSFLAAVCVCVTVVFGGALIEAAIDHMKKV